MEPTALRRRRLLGLAAASVGAAGCLRSDPDDGAAGDRPDRADREHRAASDDGTTADADDGAGDPADDRGDTVTHEPTGGEFDPEYDHVTETLDDVPIAEQFDCADADRPTPDVEGGAEVELDRGETVRTLGALPYPDVPHERTDETAVEAFVEDHEEAYLRNRAIEQDPYHGSYRLYRHSAGVGFEAATQHGDVTVAVATVSASSYAADPENGSTAHGDGPFGSVVYAFDGTGVARLWVPGPMVLTGLDDVWLLSELDPAAWEPVHCS